MQAFSCLMVRKIIAEVRHSSKEDEEENSYEGENDSQVNISNNDAFECFSKGLVWLEQQKECDSSELMLLRKFLQSCATKDDRITSDEVSI